jgi:multidrug efflux pump subunit AcrA (membrane-fusion protein)
MRHRMRRIRWPALVVAGLLVAGSGTAYAVTSDKSDGNYRTVAATRGDVEEVLQTSGTVDAAHRADLGFATAGTVARVKVALGDTVTAGQVVATLDTTALDTAVTKAKASLARAIAQLASDEDAQAQAVSDAASTPQPSKPGGSMPSSPAGGGGTPATLATLKAQQAAVTEAQTAATEAIVAAKDALAAQVAACADAYQQATPSTEGDTQQPDATVDGDACSTALAEVQARQADVSAAQDALAKALSALAGTLSKALVASSASSARTTGDSPTSTADPSTSDATGATGGTVTAARLASDQASIEQARADLVDARQQRRQAVLRSTRSGRVVALNLARSDEVSAGDVVATVVGGKAVTIETTVPESKIDKVRVGEQVRVTTPGESSGADGTVTAIGLVADSSSGTATYPVTVTVEDPPIALPAGSSALLAIVVATAHDVVTVPTSAITRRASGTGAFVQTWDGTSLSRDAVTIGSVGARTVEVTKGLSAGDRVVIADVDQAITGAADEINDRGRFGQGPVIRLDKAGAGGGPVTFKSGG